MLKKLKSLKILLNDTLRYIQRGRKLRLGKSYCKHFIQLLGNHLKNLDSNLKDLLKIPVDVNDEIWHKHHHNAKGLHKLLPLDALYTYSILILVEETHPIFLESCLKSVLNQTSPACETLIGYQQGSKHISLIEKIKKMHPNQIKNYEFSPQQTSIDRINQLAEAASHHFLLIMHPEDWIRPDFLFRCEQTLRFFPQPSNTVVYCDANTLDSKDRFLAHKIDRKPPKLHFPYYLEPMNDKGMLIPKNLWKKCGGLRASFKGAEFQDLIFQLEKVGASFQHIPLPLYSVREQTPNTLSNDMFQKALQNYCHSKNIHWKWGVDNKLKQNRIFPEIDRTCTIQVIVPYKDQKELTLKCIHSVLKQKDIAVQITAIDNRSTDSTIAETIRKLGGEVLSIDEPFNFSRLNNLAVKLTKTAVHCDLLLFLNNDVELHEDAVAEMARWIHQPHIGIVGCSLFYPDGRLQHGGISLSSHTTPNMRWEHIEKLHSPNEMDRTKNILITDAVTAACALMKKKTFLEIGGFEEIWYPNGYSDTNLCFKITSQGLLCLYTPYAKGIHYESITRKENLEDFENSWWLHNLFKTYSPDSKAKNKK